MNELKIQNVVATANINQRLHLPSISKAFVNTEYQPRRFPGLIFRLKQPKTTTLLFSTGKMVCTGATSEQMARNAVKKVVKELRKGKIILRWMSRIAIQNVVATGDIGGGVDIEAAADVMENVMYEPEQFPGLIYRMSDPKAVILLFASGKCVITGAKSANKAKEALDIIQALLRVQGLIYPRSRVHRTREIPIG